MTAHLTIRGRKILEDGNGNFRLADVWLAADTPANKEPKDWRRLRTTVDLTEALLVRVGKSHPITENDVESVIYYRPGRGIFAHPILAVAYAAYARADLEVEVLETWLRVRGGDATLADEILQNASELANEWAARRAMSRVVRKRYTSVLADHGVDDDIGIGMCTNAIYIELLGAKAPALKKKRKVPVGGNLRDTFDLVELTATMLVEAMSSERIEDESSDGRQECVDATSKSARSVRAAIENDRQDRRRRPLAS